MQVPWFSLGIGLLTFLVTGSQVAAVSLFLAFHAVCYLVASAIAQSFKKSVEKIAPFAAMVEDAKRGRRGVCS